MMDAQNVLSTLRQEYAKRCARNQRYSLRSFSRSLGLSHTVLSLTLSGKRKPSASVTHAAGKLVCADATVRATEWHDIGTRRLEKIATWAHYGVLSLLEMEPKPRGEPWFAAKLGLSQFQVKLILRDLEAANLVKKQRGWRLTQRSITVGNPTAEISATELQRSFISKAEQCMDQVSFEKRSMTSITFCMDKKRMPSAIEKIKLFRRELCQEFEMKTGADEVYTLCVQLFPLTAD